MAGWGPSHHLSLHALLLGEPCCAIWAMRTPIMLPQMIYQPQTSCLFLSIFLAISGTMHIQHCTAILTFVVLFPEQSIFIYTRIPVIVNIVFGAEGWVLYFQLFWLLFDALRVLEVRFRHPSCLSLLMDGFSDQTWHCHVTDCIAYVPITAFTAVLHAGLNCPLPCL